MSVWASPSGVHLWLSLDNGLWAVEASRPSRSQTAGELVSPRVIHPSPEGCQGPAPLPQGGWLGLAPWGLQDQVEAVLCGTLLETTPLPGLSCLIPASPSPSSQHTSPSQACFWGPAQRILEPGLSEKQALRTGLWTESAPRRTHPWWCVMGRQDYFLRAAGPLPKTQGSGGCGWGGGGAGHSALAWCGESIIMVTTDLDGDVGHWSLPMCEQMTDPDQSSHNGKCRESQASGQH